MHWKILLGVGGALFWVAASWVLLRKADSAHPATERADGKIEFARNGFAHSFGILLAGTLVWLATEDILSSGGKPLVLLKGAGFALLALQSLFESPRTILVTHDGLEQVFWLRRKKRIPWEDIVEINTGEKSRTVTITGADGTRIVHDAQLGDRPRLLLELKQHCAENLPPDFPREPLTAETPAETNPVSARD